MNQKSGSISVRAITVRDVDTLMALTGNPHVVRYVPGMIQDREYAAAWIRGLTSNDHEMMVLHDGKVIGECSLTVHGDSGEIGLMLFPEHWRKGYGSEMVALLTELAGTLGLHAITAVTSPKNDACVGLLKKHGFEQIATGWMLNGADLETELDGLFGTVLYQKVLKDDRKKENDVCCGDEGMEEAE